MKKIFRAGKYWIGDPCYAIKDENWDKVGEETGWFGSEPDSELAEKYSGIFFYRDEKCFADGTRWGDGAYLDQHGNEYSVDAGLLGILPFDICDGNFLDGGHSFDFPNEFEVKYYNGHFEFGDVIIETDDSDIEDEPDHYYIWE